MGTVYHARQIGLDRAVALKLLWFGHGGVGAIRLARGTRLLARLSHPHIVQVHMVGKQDGWLYAVFEYVNGGDLRTALRDGPWNPRRAARLVLILAETVQFMHERGIVHRDLKPSNILLSVSGIPKIADFGLAGSVGGDDAPLDESRTTCGGTPGYMAPEQIGGRRSAIGPAADIHALGAILYELLLGRPPFLGSSRVESIRQTIKMRPKLPSRLRPGLPPALDAICLRCLRKDPGERYPDARSLAKDLTRFLNRSGFGSPWLQPFQRWIRGARESNHRDIREVEQALAMAEASLDEVEQALYEARIERAEAQIGRGDLEAARSTLNECAPRPARIDRRDLHWTKLWERCGGAVADLDRIDPGPRRVPDDPPAIDRSV
jgi:serine/threonine-protein kinase